MKSGLFLLLPVFALAAACGKDAHEGGDPAPSGPVFSLVGLSNSAYQSGCRPETGNAERSVLELVTFAEASFTRTFHYFDGTDCADGGKRSTYVDSLANVKAEASAQLVGWQTYVYTYQAIGAQPDSAYMTALWNKDHAFGVANWVLGQRQEVAGKAYGDKDEAKNAPGDLGRRTLKIDGDSLTIARNNDKGIPSATDVYTYKRVP